MADIPEIRRAYKAEDIKNVAWVSSENSPADLVTRADCKKVLNTSLCTGELKHGIGKWIEKGSERIHY